jgi:hypothetical protein
VRRLCSVQASLGEPSEQGADLLKTNTRMECAYLALHASTDTGSSFGVWQALLTASSSSALQSQHGAHTPAHGGVVQHVVVPCRCAAVLGQHAMNMLDMKHFIVTAIVSALLNE